jgi:hypothetical protein
MGSWLQSIFQSAGRAGGELQEAKTANLQDKQRMQQFKMQMDELQQKLAAGKAPQVVHTYQGTDGKIHNLVRSPLDGKITDQVAEGPGEMSPEQKKLRDAEQALGRPLSPEEKKILVGVESKTVRPAYSTLKPDAKGKMWGLNSQTGQWEQIPEIPGSEFKAPEKKQAGLDPIITAQIGKPPDASVYPKGEEDPIYRAKAKQWGVEAENIKNRMAQQRGVGYNMSRPAGYVTPDGELVTATAATALANGYVPASPAFNAMSKQAQFSEMKSASTKLRDSIQALQPGDAFTPEQVAKLKLASEAQDEGVFRSIVSNMASGTTNERQQDYLIWLQQMGERILSLRNVAGMGQGAQDLRAAITATLPNISSGTKAFALKRLDAVDNQINLLQKGIPKVSKITDGSSTPPPGATIIKWEDVK